MRNNIKKFVLLVAMSGILMIGMSGCIKATNPNTGATTHSLDPNHPAVTGAETAIGAGAAIGTSLGPFVPYATLVGGILSGILGAWLKVKPKLVAAQKSEELAYNATEALVSGIEELKKISPDGWNKLKDALKIGPEAENVIRGLRGLPPLV